MRSTRQACFKRQQKGKQHLAAASDCPTAARSWAPTSSNHASALPVTSSACYAEVRLLQRSWPLCVCMFSIVLSLAALLQRAAAPSVLRIVLRLSPGLAVAALLLRHAPQCRVNVPAAAHPVNGGGVQGCDKVVSLFTCAGRFIRVFCAESTRVLQPVMQAVELGRSRRHRTLEAEQRGQSGSARCTHQREQSRSDRVSGRRQLFPFPH